MSTTRTTDDRAVCPCQPRHLTRRRQLSHFLTHPRFNYHLDLHGDHGHHPGGAQQQPGQQLPFVDQDQDWGGRVWGGRSRGILVMSLPILSPCRWEAHARRTGGGRGEGRAGEQESRRRCRWSRRGKSWTNIELKTKVASGVDQEPRSKQNSLRCQEFHALWSWNPLFASGVENSICTDAETDATHKVFRAPTFTFQT